MLRSSVTSSDVDHLLEVPAWMFDRATVSVCGGRWACRLGGAHDACGAFAAGGERRQGNDRLLLGLKGSPKEYELDLLRQRSLSARMRRRAAAN